MKNQFFPYAFFQDKFIPFEEAKVSIATNTMQYGTGVFAGIRGYYNEKTKCIFVFRLDDHIKRFLSSLKILNVSINYSPSQLKTIVINLIKRNKPKTDIYLRPFAYIGRLGLSPNLFNDRLFDFSIYMIPLAEYLSINKGLKVKVSSFRRVQDNAIPSRGKISGAYVNSALARAEAEREGCDEAIMLNDVGHVAEGSAENIFIVREGKLITPSLSDDILEGITRRTVIKLAKDLKIPVEERSVDRTELYLANEVFFSGTGVQISWIREIDGRVVGNGNIGPITDQLQKLFFKIVRGNHKKYSQKWCIKI